MIAIAWSDARRIARETAVPLDPVEVTLSEASGSALAAPLVALSPLPSYDAAAMDGYAVAGSGPWTVMGRVLAGDPTPVDVLRPGCAVEVATGAVVASGAEAILPYEQARREADTVTGCIEAGRHIRRRGEDCPIGRELLPAGTLVTPAILGLAASLGLDRLRVHRRPRVGVIVTGAELLSSRAPSAGTRPGRDRSAATPGWCTRPAAS